MEAVPIEVNFIGKEWILSMINQTKQNNGKLATTALITTNIQTTHQCPKALINRQHSRYEYKYW